MLGNKLLNQISKVAKVGVQGVNLPSHPLKLLPLVLKFKLEGLRTGSALELLDSELLQV